MKRLVLMLVMVLALFAASASTALAGDFLFGDNHWSNGQNAQATIRVIDRDNGYTWWVGTDGSGRWTLNTNFHPFYGWHVTAYRNAGCWAYSSDPVIIGGGASLVGSFTTYLRYAVYACTPSKVGGG